MKNTKYKIGVIALAFAVILVTLAFAGCASAKTITVPDDYSTIQGAVNAADPADTIYVRSGVYIEHVTVGKSLTLTGEDKETTIIDGSGTGYVIYVTADNVDISGFTVQNGENGIRLSSSYNTISNNIISNHDVGVSGVKYGSGYNLIIDSSLTNCREGIVLWVGHHNTYENCSASYCSTGFRVGWGHHNLVKDCKAWNCGGGITLDSCQYTRVENCDLSFNDGNGIMIWSCGAAKYNTITDCNVYLNGIGISAYDQVGRGHGRYNKIYHNNIVNNIEYQARDNQYYPNEWDDGYPSGGNYWSDYTGVDLYSGPHQDIPGSDGIGDTTYDISGSAGAQDRYPFDTTPLEITCPAEVTVEQESEAGTAVPLTATATDICDADPTITSDAQAIYPLGTTTVTFTATDDAGNTASCTTTVTVMDTKPPDISCPADVTVEQESEAGTAVPLTATATDICDADPTITSSGELPIYPLGSTTVTFTAEDDSGNTASCTTTVTVVDTTDPVITCPEDVTVEQETADGTVVPLTATATDICDADPMITSSGELPIYPLGSTTVTFTAEDDSGNTASCTTTVTVVDTTDPVITCPADLTVEQETTDGTVVPLTATATDICDADPTITSDELAIYPLGTTTVTFTAKDDSGNSASCSMTVTVVDTTPPVITCPADVTVEQKTAAGTVVPLTATATDICDTEVEITSDAPAIFPLGTTTVTFTATDDSGNSVSDTVIVTVEDTTAPVLTCPEDVTVEQETADGTVVPLVATATDICDADVEITSDELAVYPLGDTTVTFTATDDSGNSATDTVVVTVIDTTLPEISIAVSPDTLWPANHKMVDITATVTVNDICDAAPTVVLTSVTSNEPDDAKGKGDGKTVDDIQGDDIGTEDYSFQLRAERDGKGDGRVYTITYMVTDASGNSASASATVVVPHDRG